jgi:exopolyphosphatase/guanosine-5'-triphosphate,3'-diphosphate pyrophosphatase
MYLIENTEMPGFTSNEKKLIAQVARYHRKSLPKTKHKEFNKLNQQEKKAVWVLGGILRIVEGLDRRQNKLIKSIKVNSTKDFIHIDAEKVEGSDPDVELWGAYRRKDMLEEVIGKKIIIKIQDELK